MSLFSRSPTIPSKPIQGVLKNKSILIVEDERAVRTLLKDIFFITGAQVTAVSDGKECMREFRTQPFDLILLDIMLPGESGLELCARIRQSSDVPIIMVSALNLPDVIVAGLESGANDYVTKPFEIQILVDRALSTLKKTAASRSRSAHNYNDGYLYVDFDQQNVRVNGTPINLSSTEYRILAELVKHAGTVRTFSQIMDMVWGQEFSASHEYIHLYLSRLRKKLEVNPQHPAYLIKSHRIGYRFEGKKQAAR